MRVSIVAKYLYWGATFKLRLRIRQQRCIDRIKKSGLFDEAYYALWNPDVDRALWDPIDHYVMEGAAEGRDPHVLFSTEFYLSSHSDLNRKGVNPFDHWMQVGVREGRSPHPLLSDRSGRRSGRKPAVTEAKIVLSEGTDRTLLVLRAESERREKERPDSDSLLFKSVTSFVYDKQAGCLESATKEPRTVLVFTDELPGPSGALGQSAQWQILEHFENSGDRVVLVYCMLPGQVGTDLLIEKAAADRRNFIAVSNDGEVRVKFENFFLDFKESLAMGPIVSPALRNAALLSDGPLAEGDQVAGSKPFWEVLARFGQWMPQPYTVLASSLGQASLLGAIPGDSLKLLDVRQEAVLRVEEVSSKTSGEDDFEKYRRKSFSYADRMLVNFEQVQALESLVPASNFVILAPDFSGVPMFRHGASSSGASDTAKVLLVASNSSELAADLEEFLQLVWPLVLEMRPSSRLCIAGLPLDVVPVGIPGLSVASASDLLPKQYGEARLVVNALKSGAGVVENSLEALVFGCPVVTWPAGIYGLPPQVSRYCSVARDVYEFASKILNFLEEGIDFERAVVARQAVDDYFSEGKPYRLLEKAITQFFEQVRDGEESASGLGIPREDS